MRIRLLVAIMCISLAFGAALVRDGADFANPIDTELVPPVCPVVKTDTYDRYLDVHRTFFISRTAFLGRLKGYVSGVRATLDQTCQHCHALYDDAKTAYGPCLDYTAGPDGGLNPAITCFDSIDDFLTNSVCEPTVCFDHAQATCAYSPLSTNPSLEPTSPADSARFNSCGVCRTYTGCMDTNGDGIPENQDRGFIDRDNEALCAVDLAHTIDMCKVDGSKESGFVHGTASPCAVRDGLIALEEFIDAYVADLGQVIQRLEAWGSDVRGGLEVGAVSAASVRNQDRLVKEVRGLLSPYSEDDVVDAFQRNITQAILMMGGMPASAGHQGFWGDLNIAAWGTHSNVFVTPAGDCPALPTDRDVVFAVEPGLPVDDDNFDLDQIWKAEDKYLMVEQLGLLHEHLPGRMGCDGDDRCVFLRTPGCLDYTTAGMSLHAGRSVAAEMMANDQDSVLALTCREQGCPAIGACSSGDGACCLCPFSEIPLRSGTISVTLSLTSNRAEVVAIDNDATVMIGARIQNQGLTAFSGTLSLEDIEGACLEAPYDVSALTDVRDIVLCEYKPSEGERSSGRIHVRLVLRDEDGEAVSSDKGTVAVSTGVIVTQAYVMTDRPAALVRVGEEARAVVKVHNLGDLARKLITVAVDDLTEGETLVRTVLDRQVERTIILESEPFHVPLYSLRHSLDISVTMAEPDGSGEEQVDLGHLVEHQATVTGTAVTAVARFIQNGHFSLHTPLGIPSRAIIEIRNPGRTSIDVAVETNLTDPEGESLEELNERLVLPPGTGRTIEVIEEFTPTSEGRYRLRAAFHGPDGEVLSNEIDLSLRARIGTLPLKQQGSVTLVGSGCTVSYECKCESGCDIEIVPDACTILPSCMCVCEP